MYKLIEHVSKQIEIEEGWRENIAAGSLALGLLTGATNADASQVTKQSTNIVQNDTRGIETVAKVIAGEAAGEGKTGMLAVACVIQNRGGNPVSVVKKPYQFSAYADKALMDRNYAKVAPVAKEIASKIGSLQDITNGATHYVTNSLYAKKSKNPKNWISKMRITKVIGNHTFLKEK